MAMTSPVVASLAGRSPQPYSSITVSPDRRHAIVSGKDNLRVLSVGPSGLDEIRSIRISQHFQATSTTSFSPTTKAGAGRQRPNNQHHPQHTYGDVRDAFGLPKNAPAPAPQQAQIGGGGGANVTITDVAWSLPQRYRSAKSPFGGGGPEGGLGSTGASMGGNGNGTGGGNAGVGGTPNPSDWEGLPPGSAMVAMASPDAIGKASTDTVGSGGSVDHHHHPSLFGHHHHTSEAAASFADEDSIVAAAGSNGVVVVWRARSALLGEGAASSTLGRGSPVTTSTGVPQGFGRHQRPHWGGRLSMRHTKFSSSATSSSPSSASSAAASAVSGQPEAVLVEHSRAVNRLAWHPTGRRPGLLLTASQDSTVKLWDRRVSSSRAAPASPAPPTGGGGIRSWFGLQSQYASGSHTSSPTRSYSWHCTSTFHPKCEAVRDVKWSPFNDDVFAMVTDSGYLVVYDIRVTVRPWIKIAAHSGEATTIDWHPTRRYIVATGGGRDRNVKVWDVQAGLSLSKTEDCAENIKLNSNSARSDSSDMGTAASTELSPASNDDGPMNRPMVSHGASTPASLNSSSTSSLGPSLNRSLSGLPLSSGPRSYKNAAALNLHVLSISAPVTRLKWRPPASNVESLHVDQARSLDFVDHHNAMMAVATAPISGANAGGFGSIGLWSYHRPFMPLSVVEGHKEGAVTEFIWFDTPQVEGRSAVDGYPDIGSNELIGRRQTKDDGRGTPSGLHGSKVTRRGKEQQNLTSPNADLAVERFASRTRTALQSTGTSTDMRMKNLRNVGEIKTDEVRAESWELSDTSSTSGTWQHVLSVGRDGRCLLQSFARGERPISQVPPSTIAVANLSPFQRRFGSLQIMSVHQKVPSGQNNDFKLTGLRQDKGTAQAPGVFQEQPPDIEDAKKRNWNWNPKAGGQREPALPPELVFSVIDQGDIDNLSQPRTKTKGVITVAQEVVHLSRFASSYELYTDPKNFPTKASLCKHNAKVAESLCCGALSRMWRMIASLLDGSSSDESSNGTPANLPPKNALDFLLFPTLRSLLFERANAGDVQTCVAICELVQVVSPPTPTQRGSQWHGGGRSDVPENTTLIPGLDISIVREWYFAYIELLQQMCLFSQASALIRGCNDPVIAALNQQSTTIHESCPNCAKPLLGATASNENDRNGGHVLTTQRACKNCRKKIGLCFLCHQPVKGVFVWCPGCGHGGHLDHALEWFGGTNGKNVREVCPTGCGHKCNLLQNISAFPKTESLLRCMPASK